MPGCTQAWWLKVLLAMTWLRNTPFVERSENSRSRLMTFPIWGWSAMQRANARFYLYFASSVSDSLWPSDLHLVSFIVARATFGLWLRFPCAVSPLLNSVSFCVSRSRSECGWQSPSGQLSPGHACRCVRVRGACKGSLLQGRDQMSYVIVQSPLS